MKRFLYLGTDPSYFIQKVKGEVVHYPVIHLTFHPFPPELAIRATHILFTSKNSVHFFFKQHTPHNQQNFIAIGETTASVLREKGFIPNFIPSLETQEGLIDLLAVQNMDDWFIFYPRSSAARPLLADYLKKRKVSFAVWDLYDPVAQKIEPVPQLETFDGVVFTSPSTVRAFFQIFSTLPVPAIAIGPVTKLVLKEFSVFNFQDTL